LRAFYSYVNIRLETNIENIGKGKWNAFVLQVSSFPDEEWISLRTTNIVERLNKEFKRKFNNNLEKTY